LLATVVSGLLLAMRLLVLLHCKVASKAHIFWGQVGTGVHAGCGRSIDTRECMLVLTSGNGLSVTYSMSYRARLTITTCTVQCMGYSQETLYLLCETAYPLMTSQSLRWFFIGLLDDQNWNASAADVSSPKNLEYHALFVVREDTIGKCAQRPKWCSPHRLESSLVKPLSG
jgi:hypothetical protein